MPDMFEKVAKGWRSAWHWSKDFPVSRTIFARVENKRFRDPMDVVMVKRDYEDSIKLEALRKRQAEARKVINKERALARLARYKADKGRNSANRSVANSIREHLRGEYNANKHIKKYNFYNSAKPLAYKTKTPYRKYY